MASWIPLAALMTALLLLPAGAAGIGPKQAEKLEHLVRQDCGSCHGLTLKGGLGRPIDRDRMRQYDREVLRDIILDGVPGTAMPPWRPLISENEAQWIADYLREQRQ
ncbi:MAG: cytochrome c [Rhizobiaceae bacterium]